MKIMKAAARSYDSLTASVAVGSACFFGLTSIDSLPIWFAPLASLTAAVAIYLIPRKTRRILSTDGKFLTIETHASVKRLAKFEIKAYQIMKVSDYRLEVDLCDEERILLPLQGFFSEHSVRRVFQALGVPNRGDEQAVAPNRSLPHTLKSTSSIRGSEDF